jgi:hypothetical protein
VARALSCPASSARHPVDDRRGPRAGTRVSQADHTFDVHSGADRTTGAYPNTAPSDRFGLNDAPGGDEVRSLWGPPRATPLPAMDHRPWGPHRIELHKRLHTYRTLENMQVDAERKVGISGTFAEPSDGLEPSTPSLPCDPNGSRWQRFPASSSCFGASATRTFATRCAPSVPYLFHPNRPKTRV